MMMLPSVLQPNTVMTFYLVEELCSGPRGRKGRGTDWFCWICCL